jgi:hypothetical protein
VTKRNDMDAARTLLSRGLRSCPGSSSLWHEYFRLELVYALRLKERRDVLGLAGGTPGSDDEGEGGVTAAVVEELEPAKALLLAGGVARVVHKQAMAALGDAPVAFHTVRHSCACVTRHAPCSMQQRRVSTHCAMRLTRGSSRGAGLPGRAGVAAGGVPRRGGGGAGGAGGHLPRGRRRVAPGK